MANITKFTLADTALNEIILNICSGIGYSVLHLQLLESVPPMSDGWFLNLVALRTQICYDELEK